MRGGGEAIGEGDFVRWIKKPGDKVDRDEPLLEISTDKVDAEIPSPAAGTLSEVLVKEGQTVAVNSVVARIAGECESAKPAPAAPKPAPAPEPSVVAGAPPPPEPARAQATTHKPARPTPPQQSQNSPPPQHRHP